MIPRTHTIATFLCFIFCALVGATVPAQKPAPNETDLALAYVRLERSVREHPPAATRLAQFNRAADAVMADFSSGRIVQAAERLDSLSLSLLVPNGPKPEHHFAAALRARVTPDVFNTSSAETPALQLYTLYPVNGAHAQGMTVRIRSLQGKVISEKHQTVDLSAQNQQIVSIDLSDTSTIPAGLYLIEVVTSDQLSFEVGRWTVVDHDIEQSRARTLRLLSGRDDARTSSNVELLLQRNRLLDTGSTRSDLSHWMIDRARLAAELAREVEILQNGGQPLRNHPGFMRLTFALSNNRLVPANVVAPDLVHDDTPLPVVVALHGAGGNEFMFSDGYGGGILREMTQREQFILVSPATYPFVTSPELFEELIDSLDTLYPVNRARIFVLGHSLGAMATARIASACPSLVRACGIIAGGASVPRGPNAPPTMVYAAELDTILPPDTTSAAVREARSRGRDITLDVRSDYGHVLIVSAVLDDCMDWLFSH